MTTAAHGAEVIDSHHHLWPEEAIPDQEWRPAADTAIRRPFEPEDFARELAEAGVTGSVLMQSVDAAAENDRLFAYARSNDFIRGVVAWAPLADAQAATGTLRDLLESRAAGGAEKLAGVRCLVGTDPMVWAESEEGLRVFRSLAAAGLAWDTVPITPDQVAAVCRVAGAVPELRIVIDHLASPPLSDEGLPGWRERATALAAFENVAMKLSVGVAVLTRWDAWDTASLSPYFSHALESFGPERCMLASNWPVVLLRAGYQRAWAETRAAVQEQLTDEERRQVEAGTAARWYGLEGRMT